MFGENDAAGVEVVSEAGTPASSRRRPSRAVPTDRIAFLKQMDLLRAYAAISGGDRRAVSLAEVGQATQMTPATASLANAFFLDVGFLVKHEPPRSGSGDGPSQLGFLPTQDTLDYNQAHTWRAENAAHKLAPALGKSWGWEAVKGRLAYAEATEQDVVRLLAEKSSASPHYEPQFKIMIAYFESAGLVTREGQSIRLVRQEPKADPAAIPSEQSAVEATTVRDELVPTAPPSSGGSPSTTLPDLSGVHPAITGLLQLLPPPRAPWKHGKDDWIKAFTATIDAVYPSSDSGQEEVPEG